MPAQTQKASSPKSSETQTRRLSETIGLVLLLLAIPTPQQSATSGLDNVGRVHTSAKPTFLHYAASMLHDVPSDSSVLNRLLLEDDEEETNSNSDSTNGESLEVSSHSGSIHSDAAPIILGYVSLKQLVALKHDKLALNAALRATTTPTTERTSGVASSTASLAVPGHAVFIKMPSFGGLDDSKFTTMRSASLNEAQLKDITQWQCNACRYRNPQGQQTCMNSMCQASCDVTQRSLRAFFGQLRKEQSVEFVQWMVTTLCPGVELLHIENHTNVKTGRGKGCAWVYTNSRANLDELLTLHKRVFVDVVDGEEGMWLVSEDNESLIALSDYVGAQERDVEQSKFLPKQALVIETPKERSMPPARTRDITTPQQKVPSVANHGPYTSTYEQQATSSYYNGDYSSYYNHPYSAYNSTSCGATCTCYECQSYSNNYYGYQQPQYSAYNSYSTSAYYYPAAAENTADYYYQPHHATPQKIQQGETYQHSPYSY